MDPVHPPDTQQLNPASRSPAVPDTPSVHPPRLPAELEQLIERIGARHITDMQLLSDAVRRFHAAQVAQWEQQIRLLHQRVETTERERIEHQPLVDPGMIEVALVIAAAGFVLAGNGDAPATFTLSAYVAFLLGGVAALVLYVMYIVEWLGKWVESSTFGSHRGYAVFFSHVIILIVLIWIFRIALEALGVPAVIIPLFIPVGVGAVVYVLRIAVANIAQNTRRRRSPIDSSRSPRPTDDHRPITQSRSQRSMDIRILAVLFFLMALGGLLTGWLWSALTPPSG
jgi:hypothetical protein